jgi:hypothetical protein
LQADADGKRFSLQETVGFVLGAAVVVAGHQEFKHLSEQRTNSQTTISSKLSSMDTKLTVITTSLSTKVDNSRVDTLLMTGAALTMMAAVIGSLFGAWFIETWKRNALAKLMQKGSHSHAEK